MRDAEGERDGRPEERATSDAQPSFPSQAVVGVVDDPRELTHVVEELSSAGLRADVFCGERGVDRIEQAGGNARDLHVTRAVESLFGFEAGHAERHRREVDEGNFVVLVASEDDPTTERIRDVFADHGGHFVNHYGRWTGRTLIP